MKKIKVIILLFFAIILLGCSKEEKTGSIWPTDSVIKYTSGSIVSVKNENIKYEIKIDNTSKEEYDNYIEALKTVTFYELDNTNSVWRGTNDTQFISVEYIPSNSSTYTGYNVQINIYNSKPESWN